MKKNKPYGAAAALLAGALLGGLMTAPGAHAVDFRVKGVWIAMLEYGDGGSFVRKDREGKNVQGWGRWGEDRFEAKSVYFEIGGATWGRARSGGALGADGQIVKIKHSYLDWNLPGTGIKARMGLQRIFLPDFVTDASQVFDADVAGISVAAPLTEHLSLTAFWARAFNDNWTAPDGGQSGWLDNADFFGLLLPVTYEDIRLTPWALLGTIGKNAFRHGNGRFYSRNSEGSYGIGLSPSAYRFDGRESSLAHATAFWAGLTGEITAARPLRLAWSAAWGSVATGDAALDRHGWYASALAEYALDWGTPGIYGWYSSGDDGDPANGSERMPTIEANNEGTNSVAGFGTLGTWTLGRDTLLGSTLVGTWGLGLLGGAYMTETFRSGLESIPPIQAESAQSLGMTRAQTFRRVILPQALATSVPGLVANVVFLLKETSVFSTVSLMDLMFTAKDLIGMYAKTLECLTLLVGFYLLMLLPVSLAGDWLERRLRRGAFGN